MVCAALEFDSATVVAGNKAGVPSDILRGTSLIWVECLVIACDRVDVAASKRRRNLDTPYVLDMQRVCSVGYRGLTRSAAANDNFD